LCELLAGKPTAFTAAERAERKALADLAIEALRKAAALGIDLKLLRADPILNPLRGRADFQLLVMDLRPIP
jgi:hypothetical protein